MITNVVAPAAGPVVRDGSVRVPGPVGGGVEPDEAAATTDPGTCAPLLHLVTDEAGELLGLRALRTGPAGPTRAPAVLGTATPATNIRLRDALAMVALALSPDAMDDGDGRGIADTDLRDRVELLERLSGLAASGLATTLAAMRRSGTIRADGAASTAEWVKANTARSATDAARTARLADNLDALPATADALADGRLTAEAADAVVKAARDGRMGAPAQVEADLIGLATTGSPERLRAHIRRRRHAVDSAAMLRDEQRQHVARRLDLHRRDNGMWHLDGELPDEVGQQFATALDAFDHPDPDGTPLLRRRRPVQRRADALAALLGVALDRGLAPGTGGIVRPHISVIVPATTMSADLPAGHTATECAAPAHGEGCGDDTACPDAPHGRHGPTDAPHGRHGPTDGDGHAPRAHAIRPDVTGPAVDDPAWGALPAGDLAWGGRLSPQAVRRICCDANVTRIIMTPDSQVLDVGRTTRTWTQPQRRAINARDRHCRGPTCTRPIGWTQVHHIRWWRRDDGPTNLDNGIALCTHCHHLVHDRGWQVALDPATTTATWTSPTGHVTTTTPGTGDTGEVDEWRPAPASPSTPGEGM